MDKKRRFSLPEYERDIPRHEPCVLANIKKISLRLSLSCPLDKSYGERNNNITVAGKFPKVPSRSGVITKQPCPSSAYAPVSQNSITSEDFSMRSDCLSCLHKTQQVISCCTCVWCLNACHYHCLTKDDIGYNDFSFKQFCSCSNMTRDSATKKCALMTSCLPCLPLLALYPILNGIVKSCIKVCE